MDNAAKALLMAAAILIAVAIVGIGIYILTSSNAMKKAAVNQIDPTTVSTINSQLEVYSGKVKGTQLIQCINAARAINNKHSFPELITLKGSPLPNSTISGINELSDYTISFKYSTMGYITDISYELSK